MGKQASKPKMRGGVIRRPSGNWAYVVRVADDKRPGKTKPKWVGGYATQSAAKDARAKAVNDTARGTYVERKPTTLGEWLTEWLDARAGKLSPSTEESYRRTVRLYVMPHPIAHTNLQALSPMQLSAHWQNMYERGGKGGKSLTVRTARYANTIVSKALTDAVKNRRLEVNPAKGVELPKDHTPSDGDDGPAAWTPDELRSFLTATANDARLHTLWVVLAYTGMRRGEALALQWDNVDTDDGTVNVRRAVAETASGISYGKPKNGDTRRVTAPHVVRDALKAWRKVQAAEQLAAGPLYSNDDGYVFTMPDGRPIRPGYATKAFTKAVASADVSRIRLHDLRHTAATLLLRDGAPITAVSKMLGHKTVSITMDVYSHCLPDDLTELASRLDRIAGEAQ